MLEEAVSVVLGLQGAWLERVCHVAFHSTDSTSACLRTLCTPSSCGSSRGDRAEVERVADLVTALEEIEKHLLYEGAVGDNLKSLRIKWLRGARE